MNSKLKQHLEDNFELIFADHNSNQFILERQCEDDSTLFERVLLERNRVNSRITEVSIKRPPPKRQKYEMTTRERQELYNTRQKRLHTVDSLEDSI